MYNLVEEYTTFIVNRINAKKWSTAVYNVFRFYFFFSFVLYIVGFVVAQVIDLDQPPFPFPG